MAHSAENSLLQTQMQLDPAKRPRYTQDQLQQYFTRISLPEQWYKSPVLADPSLAKSKEHGLPLVHVLTRHHAKSIPFENLELHYSAHKTISLDMDDLYDKFLVRGLKYSRGGRCMENNGFFGTVLRSLGYDVRNCAGRVSRSTNPDKKTRELQGQTYDAWNHMLNLVRFDDQLYVVDVGMGAKGPNIPYPLVDGYETESIAPRRIRLQKRSIPEHAALHEQGTPRLWCYDVNHAGDGRTWIPTYCFTETEFLPQDYEMMSWFTSTHKHSFFTRSVLCTRIQLSEDQEKIVGDITLFGNSIRRTIGSDREVLKECNSEEERVQALKDILGLDLTEEEKAGISEGMKL